jgi:hypothetical protein
MPSTAAFELRRHRRSAAVATCQGREAYANKDTRCGIEVVHERLSAGRMDRMIINMTTIACRQTHYIDTTLARLFESDGRNVPVNLILGSTDTSHVEKYRDVANIVPWDEAAQAQEREGKPRHNCNLNAIRALRYGGDEHCLCCEDDILFEEDWLSQLMLTIAEIPETEYALNLGQGRDQSPDKRYAVHTRSSLCGAQAIFYPTKALRTRVAEYVELKIRNGMNDQLIGAYAKQHSVLYNTTPVLVRHIGQVSCFHPPPEAPDVRRPDGGDT